MTNNRTFEQWLKAVDQQCWRHGGLALSDLPDMDYRFMYDHNVSEKSAACRRVNL
jgi:hypothetical protein